MSVCTDVGRALYHATPLLTDPYDKNKRCSSFRKKRRNASCRGGDTVGSQLLQYTRMYPCTQLAIYAASLRWQPTKFCGVLWPCNRAVSGVVVSKTGVKCPFVLFCRIYSIEKAKAVSYRDQNKSGERNQASKGSVLIDRREGLWLRRLINVLLLDASSFPFPAFFGLDETRPKFFLFCTRSRANIKN